MQDLCFVARSRRSQECGRSRWSPFPRCYWAWELLPARADRRVSPGPSRGIRPRPHSQPRRPRRRLQFGQLWLPHPLLRSPRQAMHRRPRRPYYPPRLLSRSPPPQRLLPPSGHPNPEALTAAPREMSGRTARCSARVSCALTPRPATTGSRRREDSSCASAAFTSRHFELSGAFERRPSHSRQTAWRRPCSPVNPG